ncbi:MAG: thioredoxin family protein [Ignavibacteriaceae bacterium]|nr:thioredoxin family protein [Ignavibacteriaceae bacterium]
MISIKILGTGCKKCQTLETKVRELVAQNGFDVDVEKVTDINKMIDYGIMMTPGLVVNNKVVSAGIVPKDDQIIKWIKGEQND